MKKYAYISFLMLFFSCSSIDKNSNKVIKSYLLDKNRINKFEEICSSNKIDIPDTILICAIARSNRTFQRYLFTEKINNQNSISFWIDCKKKFILDEKDLVYINDQILKTNFKNTLFDVKKLNFNNYVITNNEKNDNEFTKNSITYHFSKPIICLDNNYSIFYFECYIDSLEKSYCLKSDYIIMKKNNNKWSLLGELCKNNILD